MKNWIGLQSMLQQTHVFASLLKPSTPESNTKNTSFDCFYSKKGMRKTHLVKNLQKRLILSKYRSLSNLSQLIKRSAVKNSLFQNETTAGCRKYIFMTLINNAY